MAYFEHNSPSYLVLKSMVQKVGLRNVVWALSKICEDNEQVHLETGHDQDIAKSWRSDADKLNTTAGKLAG